MSPWWCLSDPDLLGFQVEVLKIYHFKRDFLAMVRPENRVRTPTKVRVGNPTYTTLNREGLLIREMQNDLNLLKMTYLCNSLNGVLLFCKISLLAI